VLHECYFEAFWCLILLRLGRFTDILDTGDQVLDVMREVLLLVSPASISVSI
jgi:hypothetical protein